MARRPLVRSTADKVQVDRADRTQKDRRATELIELGAVLADPMGRRTLWRFLRFCGAFETVLRRDALEMAAAAGRQNVGQWLMSEIDAANPDALFLMMREARAAEDRENAETAGIQTKRAEERAEETDDDGN